MNDALSEIARRRREREMARGRADLDRDMAGLADALAGHPQAAETLMTWLDAATPPEALRRAPPGVLRLVHRLAQNALGMVVTREGWIGRVTGEESDAR